jgi:uncharacterized heparinase superfamily protein
MPMLRFFRHGDGHFAHFNGMGPTHPDLVATVLAYDDARGAPLANATHSGYQRMQAGDLVLLVETGRPPPPSLSQEAHAGCLSFELSARQQQIVVNCGVPELNRESWRQVARATAAHSTVTFNDTSSCHFLEAGAFRNLLFGTIIVGGPTEVLVTRHDEDGDVVLRASHDGYAGSFGFIHERRLSLAGDASRLDGEDVFKSAGHAILRSAEDDQYAIRFHLHPSVRASRLDDAHGVMLVLPDKEVWTFNAHQDEPMLEESVYLGSTEGPRRTVQIVIYGRARAKPSVHWTLARSSAAASEPRSGGAEPELPL